ncbi:MAG: GDYXXLXY domain-containing protein [Hyphomicrobiaceae bacterium]
MLSQPRASTIGVPWGAPPALIGLLIAGALVGLGLILWIAANWQDFGKVGRFTLVASIILSAAVIGIVSSRARVAAALLGVFAIGGLFALFGQTYQSTADAYELFAVWAAVALPWVIAARHDAVWCLWVVIAFTALPLWLAAQGPGYSQNVLDALTAWAIAIALGALLSPWSGLERFIGSTHWAFRLAGILACLLVVSSAIGAGPDRAPFWIGLAIMAAAVVGLAWLRPFDLMLLTAATFGLDVLTIYALAKPLLGTSYDQGGLLLTGLISAVVIAGSAAAILKIAGAQSDTRFTLSTNADAGRDTNTWPVTVLSGVGALLTAVPVIAFLALTFGRALWEGMSTYIMSVAALAGAIALMRGSDSKSFRQQLAFIGLVIGLLLLSFAVFRDMPRTFAAVGMLAVCTGLAVVVPVRWVASLLGATSAGFFVFAVSNLLKGLNASDLPDIRWTIACLVVAAIGALSLSRINGQAISMTTFSQTSIARAQAFVTGWCGGALMITLAGNPTFLLSRGFQRLANATIPIELGPNISNGLALALVGGGITFLMSRGSAWRNLPTAAICGVLAVLAYVRPPIAGAFAIYVAARVTGHRPLTYLSAFAIIWLIGSFYYWLGWPLTAKAYLLGCLGIALGGVILASGELHRAITLPTEHSPTTQPVLAIALTLVSVLATAATVGTGIWQNEDIIKNGRRIFIALGPVDPRSLMRGDYMALNIRAPRLPRSNRTRRRNETPVWASASIDKDDVATINRYAYRGADTIYGDIVLQIRMQGGRVVIGTNAYFFPEGQGAKYSKARFGEFRVGKDGKPLLTGLADENRQRID